MRDAECGLRNNNIRKGLGILWLLPVSQFRSNSAGITCTMKKPEYNNPVTFYRKINSVRKSPK
jgi:hypothetical protein